MDTKKEGMLKAVKDEMTEVFNGSLIAESFPADFNQYERFVKTWKTEHFADSNHLLGGAIEQVYDSLFRQRNRCAHNTASYQQDAITLSEMQKGQMLNSNYFSYFAILLLVDKIFIEVFCAFKESYESRV